jgi:hypothetical protein
MIGWPSLVIKATLLAAFYYTICVGRKSEVSDGAVQSQ